MLCDEFGILCRLLRNTGLSDCRAGADGCLLRPCLGGLAAWIARIWRASAFRPCLRSVNIGLHDAGQAAIHRLSRGERRHGDIVVGSGNGLRFGRDGPASCDDLRRGDAHNLCAVISRDGKIVRLRPNACGKVFRADIVNHVFSLSQLCPSTERSGHAIISSDRDNGRCITPWP